MIDLRTPTNPTTNPTTTSSSPSSCLQHGANPVTAYCVRCGRPICDLCTFWVGSAIFCPECLSSGPSADERTSVTVKGILSILLSLVASLGLVGSMVLGIGVEGMSQLTAMAIGFLVLGASLGGISLALIAREGARRTNSMLPLIGVVLNAIALGIHTIGILQNTFQG